MNRHDVHLLQQISGYPCITITLPTHRSAPANQQDPIRVKNLVRQTVDRLRNEFSARESELLLKRLDSVTESIDYRNTLDGMAIFVNIDMVRIFTLPFTLKERIVIDEDFFTRDLVFAMNRTPRYWTLALSEQPTRLFECTREHCTEIVGEGFPMLHEGPGGELPLPGGRGINISAQRDEYHRQFFRRVDAALKPFISDDDLPLALVGVDRNIAFFNEVSSHTQSIITSVTGSHDSAPPHEIGKLVWPLVKENLAGRRARFFDELEKAVGERKYISTVGEVWRLAKEGRGRILLVEEDYHQPVRVDETGMHIVPAEDVEAPDVTDDAVDEIVETVLEKQGQVVFVENGTLSEHSRIVLILRY